MPHARRAMTLQRRKIAFEQRDFIDRFRLFDRTAAKKYA
jgi:hypothetical protein